MKMKKLRNKDHTKISESTVLREEEDRQIPLDDVIMMILMLWRKSTQYLIKMTGVPFSCNLS